MFLEQPPCHGWPLDCPEGYSFKQLWKSEVVYAKKKISVYGESKLPTAASSRILNAARHGTARYCWAGKWVGKEMRVVGKYLISASVCVRGTCIHIHIVVYARNINCSLQIMRLSFVHAFKPPSTSKHHVHAWEIASMRGGPIQSSSFTSHGSIFSRNKLYSNSTNSFLSPNKRTHLNLLTQAMVQVIRTSVPEETFTIEHVSGDFEIFEISQHVWLTLA